MTKNLITVVFILFAVVMFVACGSGGKYGDVIEINTQFADAMEEYVGDLETANTAGSVAKAVDAFAAKVEKIAPRMRELMKKYPELKDQDKMPEALKQSQQRATELAQRMAGSFMKTMKHMRDEKVKAAHERLQKAMAKMM